MHILFTLKYFQFTFSKRFIKIILHYLKKKKTYQMPIKKNTFISFNFYLGLFNLISFSNIKNISFLKICFLHYLTFFKMFNSYFMTGKRYLFDFYLIIFFTLENEIYLLFCVTISLKKR